MMEALSRRFNYSSEQRVRKISFSKFFVMNGCISE